VLIVILFLQQEKSETGCNKRSKKDSSKNITPSNYKFKYANIIGLDAGEAAARITTPNYQFGMGNLLSASFSTKYILIQIF